ncbi:hypothetical protein L3Y34_009611 [Caenorhabditis briggsae]|uniref:CUB-like domain-containing protein n=1 Tax=Caenorhabditis briggsae TaxID=6238 RepID=A0AAE9D2M9_CAEBR|nr:hypothetical protein L3Y34_009611 [Caenorhabditis briggsae]
MVTTILLLFSFLNFISSIVPDCKNGKIIFDPTSLVHLYPENFSAPGPVFPANFSCEFQINVPEGWFARVELSLISPINSQSSAVIFDQLDRSETVFLSESDYFYFIANGGRIQFSTGSNGTKFGFIVFWDKYPTFTYAEGRVNVSDTQPFLTMAAQGGSVLIKAETIVSATIMRPQQVYQLKYTRGFIFFDGPDFNNNNTRNLGTGLQLLNGNTQYVSSGKSMTVLILDVPLNEILWLVFLDYELTKGIKSFQGADCYSGFCESFKLDATNGPAALQVYNNYGVNAISGLSGSGQLEVYIGTASQNKTNLVATYHAGETSSSLPQKVFDPTYSFAEGRVNVSDTQPFLAAAVGGSILINAETKVSATIMKPVNDYYLKYMRGFIFFDGPDFNNNNTRNLGTGLQLLNGNTQYVSSGNSMTVLILDVPLNEILRLVFLDYELTKSIKSFQGADCYSGFCESFKLDATNGPAALQVYYDQTVIGGLSGSGQLEV